MPTLPAPDQTKWQVFGTPLHGGPRKPLAAGEVQVGEQDAFPAAVYSFLRPPFWVSGSLGSFDAMDILSFPTWCLLL